MRFASVAVVLAAVGVLASPVSARPLSSPISVVSITALPPPQQRAGGLLTPGKLNVVFTAGFVSFKIELHNNGSSPKIHVAVKVVISRGTQGGPIVKTETLDSISPGQTETVIFEHVGKVPFAMQSSLAVEVTGGPITTYPVVFTSPD